MDLNLHHPPSVRPTAEVDAREVLNGVRAWLNCFNFDRVIGAQYGKESMIPNNDYIANHTDDWWRVGPWNMPSFDIHTVATTAELRCLGHFKSQIYGNPADPSGVNKVSIARKIISAGTDQLGCVSRC
jgi:hypothetical protein